MVEPPGIEPGSFILRTYIRITTILQDYLYTAVTSAGSCYEVVMKLDPSDWVSLAQTVAKE